MQSRGVTKWGCLFILIGVLWEGPALFAGDLSIPNNVNSVSGLKASLVCMMNNKYMGTEQIPVPVGNKVYYGCCQGCVGAIQSNPAVRYSQDPYSGKQVDKATAFIAKKSDATDEVFYFESKGNYEMYLQSQEGKSLSSVN